MNTTENSNWRLQVGLALSLIIGAAWGLLLGWFQIRVNAWLSPWVVVFAGMPGAFFGSMVVGMVHKRMLLSLPSVLRLVIALFIVTLGIPFGWVWGLLENGYNPYQLAKETDALVWVFEWLVAVIGLTAGVWHLWTLPVLRILGRMFSPILAGPSTLVTWIGRKIADGFNRVGQFFAAVVNALLWLPRQFVGLVTRTSQNIGTLPEQLPPPPPETSRPRRTRPATLRRTRKVKPKSVPVARGNGKSEEIARVTGVVEDRCPYCFDIVKRNDPRGVKVCETCGAPHHADCWAITGKCQVPHLNT